ncbi:MAG: rhamnan synthesis F family protein [Oscillospiraceae bacterium]|nr:rhamnan synthesis F family protein [Oscillospiraceae bacterium]MCL2278304.1 rhamnan synthesis F family protein [Oscillospiraceae bacterium]
MSKKRATIFVFYDKKGIVDEYVLHLIRGLLTVSERIIIVCNGLLGDVGRESLGKLTDDIIVRENKGYDAWAFRAGMEHIGWEHLSDYDELILANDSVYGPLYPFTDMFEEMDGRNVDFWGIIKHAETEDKSGITKNKLYYEHIQSYFYVLSKKLLAHQGFRKYWENLRDFRSWDETVSLHETGLTKYYADLGFSWDVYVSTDGELRDYADTSLVLMMPFELIRDYKCPIIKRKCFSEDYGVLHRATLGDGTKKAFDYIQRHTDYDVNLIWDNLLRTVSLRSIKDALHLNYILPKDRGTVLLSPPSSPNSAVFAHITYEDQIEFCENYLHSVTPDTDVFVTTLSESMNERILTAYRNLPCRNLKVVTLPKTHKGRDVAALWVALRLYITNYDYVCFVHNKKSAQDKPLTIGRGFAQRCFENTLASPEYVANLLSLFENNPRLGMLFPPPVIHGLYRYNITNMWGLNYQNTLDLAEKLGIDVPISDEADPVFPTGGMFWFRTKALKKMAAHEWDYSDFPDEPMPVDGSLGHAFERIYTFAAQSEGYYSAWVMTDDFADAEITSLSYLYAHVQTLLSMSLWRRILLGVVKRLRRYPGIYVVARFFYRIPKAFFGIFRSSRSSHR